MKIGLVGSGGREHALAWKISQSPLCQELYCFPGNTGTALLPKVCNISGQTILDFVQATKLDLVIIGPEQPLAEGLVDALQDKGVQVYGPQQKGAQLESSKAFCKNFLSRHNIPTAAYVICSSYQDVVVALANNPKLLVVKANGLASGKGVVVANTKQEALQAAYAMIQEKCFGEAGLTLVLEEKLVGIEASFMVMTDGQRIVPLVVAQDYKRLKNNDTGPNTGGMGAYAPSRYVDEKLKEKILTTIVEPALAGLRAERITYCGTLYFGLMLSPQGEVQVIEINCRFGDPETQLIMLQLHSDFVALCLALCTGKELVPAIWSKEKSVAIVLAAEGYPDSPRKGAHIPVRALQSQHDGIIVFHAGTGYEHNNLVANGGRVLTVCTQAETFEQAREKLYKVLPAFIWQGCQWRDDIAL